MTARGTTLMLLWLSACATPPDVTPAFSPDREQTPESTLEARRDLIEGGYGDGPTTTVVDGVEVRVSEIDMADAVLRKRVRRPRTELRVPLQNPWRLRADTTAHHSALDAQSAELDVEQTRLSTRACLRGVDAQTQEAEVDAWERYRSDVGLVRAWLDELLKDRLISEPSHAVDTARIQQQVLRARPQAAPRGQTPLVALPTLDRKPGRLDLGHDVLVSALDRHPIWLRAEAEHQHLSSLARRETSKRLPYLAWISMGYTPRFAQDRPILEGRFAVEVPLGLDARRKAQALELRAAAARLDGEARMLEQLEALRWSLEMWDAWEARIPELMAAKDAAAQHREMALAWIDTRSARPADASSLLKDAYEVERTVITARSRAGVTSCHVQGMGGVHPSDWPRTPR